MAFVTITACSNRTLLTVVRRNRLTTGWNTVIPGNFSVIIPATKSVSAAACSMKAAKFAGWKPKKCWQRRMTRSFLALIPMPPTRCACGAHRPATKSTWGNLTRAITLPRLKTKTTQRTCRACSIPMIQPILAVNCGCGRNISSSPPRCRIFSIVTGRCIKPGTISPTKLLST